MKEDARPLNGDEQYQMYFLWACMSGLEDALDGLSRRLKMVDRGAQKLKTADTYIRNVAGKILNQLSAQQRNLFIENGKRKRFRVASERIAYGKADVPEGQTVVCDSELETICNAAWKEKCQMCGLRGIEAKKCPLKKAFDDLMRIETGTNKDCWYKPEI